MSWRAVAQAQGPERLTENINAQQQEIRGYIWLKHGAINTALPLLPPVFRPEYPAPATVQTNPY